MNELDYAHHLETSKECDDEYVSLSEFDSVRHLELNSCDYLDEYDQFDEPPSVHPKFGEKEN